MTQHTFKSAYKRYWRAFIPLMIVYLAITLGGSFYLNTFETEPVWLQVTVAIACTIPMILFLYIQIRYFLETDEYNRLVQLKGFAIGAGITMSGIFLFGEALAPNVALGAALIVGAGLFTAWREIKLARGS